MFNPTLPMFRSFNLVYQEILKSLKDGGVRTTNRKGQTLIEHYDASFTFHYPLRCLAVCRNLSKRYLQKEFDFYLSGSNSVHEAASMSSFWLKCTDDGETINSNYGKLIFHDRNAKGNTQFEHALACLKNNIQSKKAVMTLYNNEHAYISNDNPCTMFLRARIDATEPVPIIHISVYMRSSDVYFGLPYDVPFFCFVLYALKEELKETYPGLELGTYTHHASSLHYYEHKDAEITQAIADNSVFRDEEFIKRLFREGLDKVRKIKPPIHELDLEPAARAMQQVSEAHLRANLLRHNPTLRYSAFAHAMQIAWSQADKAQCLKKHVGAVLVNMTMGELRTTTRAKFLESIVAKNCGGVKGEPCTSCVRDLNKAAPGSDPYYGDECPSVHAEMWCVNECIYCGFTNFTGVTVFVTHGPCDACLKLLDVLGVRTVIYDKPYKTNYKHWPRIDVLPLSKCLNL